MLPKLFVAPWSFLRVSSHGGARLAAVASLVGGVVVAALVPRAIRSAAVRPAQPPAPLAVATGDTQVVYGPTRFDTPTGSLTLHVERFALAVVPGRRYTLRVDNGATDGSHRVSGGSVILNGSQILSTADLGSGAAGCSRCPRTRSWSRSRAPRGRTSRHPCSPPRTRASSSSGRSGSSAPVARRSPRRGSSRSRPPPRPPTACAS